MFSSYLRCVKKGKPLKRQGPTSENDVLRLAYQALNEEELADCPLDGIGQTDVESSRVIEQRQMWDEDTICVCVSAANAEVMTSRTQCFVELGQSAQPLARSENKRTSVRPGMEACDLIKNHPERRQLDDLGC